MNVTQVRHWLFVGNRDECNQNGHEYGGIIHIWRDDFPEHSCQYMNGYKITDCKFHYTLEYKDGHKLPTVVLDNLRMALNDNYLKFGKESKLLVHCAAGQTRSPTIVLFVLSLVERTHPFVLLQDIYDSVWRGRGKIANICHAPLKDIVEWYENNLYNPEIFGEATAVITEHRASEGGD